MAFLAFLPPMVAAMGYALYEGAFSEEDRLAHSIGAGVLWERTKALVTRSEHPVLDGVEILGMRDDDSFFHCQRKETTERFLHYWSKHHNELAFREDLGTFLRRMKMVDLKSVLRCEVRFFFKEGIDTTDYTHHEATYYWIKHEAPSMMAFPVYEQSKAEETGGICFVQKIICGALVRNLTDSTELSVTDTIKRIAGPRGNFYQDVPKLHRPSVNLALAFWNERSDGFRYLKLIDTLGLTYVYDLEHYTVAKWPTDAQQHIFIHLPVH